MRFRCLAHELEAFCTADTRGGTDPELGRACFDSRRIRRGDLFCALPGSRVEGTRFLESARGRGAAALLLPESAAAPAGLPVLRCRAGIASREAAGRAAAILADHPSRELWVAAVTGTNGKTTVVHLAGRALDAAGVPTLRIGTLGFHFRGAEVPDPNTTPAADRLQEELRAALDRGARAAVLEASSIGLDQGRLSALAIDAAAWTNLTQDHLDYHGDMQAYARAKAGLFHALPSGSRAFLPGGEPRLQALCAGSPASVVAWSLDDPAAPLHAAFHHEEGRLHLEVRGVLGKAAFSSPLAGRHNAENLLVAFGLLRSAGLGPEEAGNALAGLEAPPGRLERVAPDSPWFLYVDYAHTPDALARTLDALRGAHPRARLGVVFGAGGDRDATKRAPMGAAVARGADWCIVTSDNPRFEEPASIAASVAAGVRQAGLEPAVELDRRRAIREGLARLRPGDVLLVAGKGHEPYQEAQGVRTPFDDRKELAGAVSCLS